MRYFFSLFLLVCSSVAFADTYDFGQSFWTDDYSGDPVTYAGSYSYRIYQDGVQVVEVLDKATPTIDDVITAPDGVVLTVTMRNSNSQVPVGTSGRDGPWTAQITVIEAGMPVPVTSWSIRVVHGQ